MRPSKENLLDSIRPGMRLTIGFFKKIYGYELGCPGLSEIALVKLEQAGCSQARQYYQQIVDKCEEDLKNIAAANKQRKQKGEGEDWQREQDPLMKKSKLLKKKLKLLKEKERLCATKE